MTHQNEEGFFMEEVGGGAYTYPRNGLITEHLFTGNPNDTSGNGFTGVVTGATLTTDRHGSANSAYDFVPSGPDDITVASSGALDALGSGDFSILAWVNSTLDGGSFGRSLVTKQEAANPRTGILIEIAGSTDKLRFALDFGATSSIASDTDNFPLSSAQMIGLTRIDTTIALYRQGVSVASAGPSVGLDGDVSGSWDLLFGVNRVYSTATALDGTIDEVVTYSRGLSATEMLAAYNGTKP